MKKIMFVAVAFLTHYASIAQVSGNANYQNQVRYPDNNIELNMPSNPNITISVKCLANLKADNYVAIFSVTQVGKTTEEVNSLIDGRISQALTMLKAKPGTETFVDMISFVPIYEFDVEKKLFSKKTYNEIPTGFELKKNIHIKYQDPNLLNDIIAALSVAEVYDLVRVDYFSDKMGATKAELAAKSKLLLQEKLKTLKGIIGAKIDSTEKKIVDGYRIVYPVEMYKSYQAYSNSALNLKKNEKTNMAEKSTSLYYQPAMDKEFDFVLNPTILEPVIQIMYEIKLEMIREKEIKEPSKEYYLITPSGDIRTINPRN